MCVHWLRTSEAQPNGTCYFRILSSSKGIGMFLLCFLQFQNEHSFCFCSVMNKRFPILENIKQQQVVVVVGVLVRGCSSYICHYRLPHIIYFLRQMFGPMNLCILPFLCALLTVQFVYIQLTEL